MPAKLPAPVWGTLEQAGPKAPIMAFSEPLIEEPVVALSEVVSPAAVVAESALPEPVSSPPQAANPKAPVRLRAAMRARAERL